MEVGWYIRIHTTGLRAKVDTGEQVGGEGQVMGNGGAGCSAGESGRN